MNKSYKNILLVCAIILATYFFFYGLVQAKAFLAPLMIAILLSLIVYPIALKFEKLRLPRSLSAFFSTLIVFLVSLGLIALVTFQFQNFIQKWPEIKETMAPKIERMEVFIAQNTPMSKKRIDKIVKNNNPMRPQKISNKAEKKAVNILIGTAEMLGTFLLTMIYVFFILRYRKRLKNFLFLILPNKNRNEIRKTLSEISNVISNFLLGKLILMGVLLSCYLLGLGFSGVDNFILVSLIAVTLNLIPYLGNVIGFTTALAYGYLVSGDIYVLLGVVVTFSISLFLETYVLQPYIMGSKVNVHPFLVIVIVILGGSVWGITGMIMAVPYTAIFTVLLMHITHLKKIGLLFSKDDLRPNQSS